MKDEVASRKSGTSDSRVEAPHEPAARPGTETILAASPPQVVSVTVEPALTPASPGMTGIPLVWQVDHHGVLVVGGGKAGCQKARALAKFGISIHVVEPRPTAELLALGSEIPGFTLHTAAWSGEILDRLQPRLCYACTDVPQVNEAVGEAARSKGIPFCHAALPIKGDFMSPACDIHGGFVLAVSSGGKKVKGAVALRDRLREAFRQAVAYLGA